MHFHLALFYVCACFVAINADIKLYFSSLDKVTFSEAVKLCKEVNREVIRVENSDVNDDVIGTLITISPGPQYWVGATKNSTSGDWEWYETGEKLTYFAWGNNEPVKKDNADCIKIDMKAYTNGRTWGAVDCNEKRYALCQMN
ncbi:unnamed protein product [Phyllotreta striolata]|uniref:C-type lectin domain-containing protein n=1 Tax=Phyllotreta striolata TaxID=444603 RepID=A0A9N9TUN0_PHYSR|nr:unnamed protein product [Phyllotreta striolata]